MTDGYLKFSSREEAQAVFAGIGCDLDHGLCEVDGARLDLHVLFGDGILYAPTGCMAQDEFAGEVPELAPVDGFHVNVRYAGQELPAALLPYHLTPATPKCVWG